MAKVMKPPFSHPVQEGEIRLIDFLRDNLPDDYTIIPNGEYPSEIDGNITLLEYDCIVVTPHGIYNIENKDYSGELAATNDVWWHNGKEMKNPLKTCRFKTGVLASLLKKYNPFFGLAWIDSMVTLSNPKQSKKLFSPSDAATKQTFLLDNELIEHIKKAAIINGKPAKNISHIKQEIVDFLIGSSLPPAAKDPTKILEFTVINKLAETPDYKDYRVKTDGIVKQEKRLRVYNLFSPGLSDAQQTERKNQILNQYYAFQKIKSFDYIARVECRVEENQVFEISDYVNVKTLRSVIDEKQFTDKEKIGLIFQLCKATMAAHDAGVFHRAINPDNIYYVNDKLLLANFNQSYFSEHSTENFTVQQPINQSNATPYQAPELAQKDAGRYSDIYSIGVIIYELFVGELPVKSFFELGSTNGKIPADKLPSNVNSNLPKWLDYIIEKTITLDPDARYQEVEELGDAIYEKLNITQPENEPQSHQEAQVGDNVTPSLSLVELLGQGGFSKVFRAYHSMENTEYAIKIFNSSVPLESVRPEYEALKHLDHPNIVKFHFCDMSMQGQFYTLMELLHGDNLQKYALGDGRLKLPLHNIYQLAEQILSALVYLQKQNPPIFHRDIKPQNIIWDEQKRFVLADFNVSSEENADQFLAGTQPYIPVDLVTKNNRVEWDKSADTFSFGITLYELVCKDYPWQKSPIPLPNKAPIDPIDKNDKISRAFADFLLKAIICDRNKRFKTAEEMLDALHAIGETGIEAKKEVLPPKPQPQEIITSDFVKYLNSLYSQSQYGNHGTRSSKVISPLDSETYIETKLDSELLKDICNGKYKLLIITGNAGDGKTAFIRKIEGKAENVQTFAHSNGSSFKINGIPFVSNYDGSQDEAEKVNAEVLKEFFKPFNNQTDFASVAEGRIIAINEGVLADFLGKTAELKKLADVIDEYYRNEGKSDLPPGLMIINLNLRSVTAANDEAESLFRKQLKNLCQPKFWTGCQNCPNKEFCFIKYNVDTFNDYAAGNEVLNRLEWILRMTGYRRELHITIRDLRSFISFLITADCRCEDIAKIYEQSQNPEDYWKYYYFNIIAHDGLPSQDRLITLLRKTDVALVPIPNIDRTLYSSRLDEKFFNCFADRKQTLLAEFDARKMTLREQEDGNKYILKAHQIFIRHHFFEGNFEFFKSKHTFFSRMPYKFLRHFWGLMRGDEAIEQSTREALPKAFARSAGCLDSPFIKDYLLLPASHENDPYGKTYRRFPLSDFELLIENPTHLVTYIEYENSNAIFRHKGANEQFISLNITLDLFDMLFYIEGGFSPSLNDLQGHFLEMQVFKTRLENMLYHELLITRNNKNFYLAKLDSATNKIQISELEEVEE